MDFFLKHKTVILRSLGIFMLIVSFLVYFWTTPKETLSANEIAAANVARMEARVAGSSSVEAAQKSDTKFISELKKNQADQVRYFIIILMILGVGFVGYSFVKKEEPKL